jgi:chromosome segregation ATPase
MTQDQPNRLDRLEASVATHNEILTSLAPLTAQIAQLLAQQTARGDRHDEVLSRLENSVNRHDEALTRLENSVNRQQETIDRHDIALSRIERGIEALTTSTTETIQLVAQNSIAIRDILERLDRRFNNGNGRSEQ